MDCGIESGPMDRITLPSIIRANGMHRSTGSSSVRLKEQRSPTKLAYDGPVSVNEFRLDS